jgi:hypothetical protein
MRLRFHQLRLVLPLQLQLLLRQVNLSPNQPAVHRLQQILPLRVPLQLLLL